MLKTVLILVISFSLQTSFAQSKFLLLMGPSGTGKSTLINHLKTLDDRFVYITPLTTRTLREGETDKVHVSLEDIQALQNDGKLLTVNYIYGIYYATPKALIDEALEQGKFPVLDWPIEKIEIMQSNYEKNLFRVYVEPESIDELKQRLSFDKRDTNGKRFESGLQELNTLSTGSYDQYIDLRVINQTNQAQEVAKSIYTQFLASL